MHQGWAPPVPILRTIGVRTLQEIDHEKYALKALRGDFDFGERTASVEMALRAVEA